MNQHCPAYFPTFWTLVLHWTCLKPAWFVLFWHFELLHGQLWSFPPLISSSFSCLWSFWPPMVPKVWSDGFWANLGFYPWFYNNKSQLAPWLFPSCLVMCMKAWLAWNWCELALKLRAHDILLEKVGVSPSTFLLGLDFLYILMTKCFLHMY